MQEQKTDQKIEKQATLYQFTKKIIRISEF